MYDNIGKKIKVLAQTTFVVLAIASILVGSILWYDQDEPWFALLVFLGPIVAWLLSLMTYGFGEIVDKVCDIEQNIRLDGCRKKTKKDSVNKEKIATANIDSHVCTQNSNNETPIKDIVGSPNPSDAFKMLQELYQQGLIGKPTYKIQKTHDKDGILMWHCECYVNGEEYFYDDDFYSEEYGKEIRKP